MKSQTIQKEKPKFVSETLEKLELMEDRSFPKYNLNTYRVYQLDKKTKEFEATNYQRIEYNGRFVNYMSLLYNVLPNEDVLRTADLVATRLGAEFMEPKWKGQNWKYGWCKVAGHVVTNPEKTVMLSHYKIGKPFDVTGAKDFVEFGFSVKNAIDGKGGAFQVMPMTYRGHCSNVAYHITQTATLHKGYSVPELETDYKHFAITQNAYMKDKSKVMNLKDSPELKKCWEIIDEAKANFTDTKASKPHFKTLTLAYVTNAILTTVAMGEELMKKYHQMYLTKVTEKNAKLLFEKLPKSVMKEMKWIQVDEKTKKVSLKTEVTNWKAFNDITTRLSMPTVNRNFGSTLEAYAKLDEIMVRNQ